jgi:hypothetical protein
MAPDGVGYQHSICMGVIRALSISGGGAYNDDSAPV